MSQLRKVSGKSPRKSTPKGDKTANELMAIAFSPISTLSRAVPTVIIISPKSEMPSVMQSDEKSMSCIKIYIVERIECTSYHLARTSISNRFLICDQLV